MMTRDEIKRRNPLVSTMEHFGAALFGNGNELQTNICGQQDHKQGHRCVNVNQADETWYCHDCKEGGSVIDFLALRKGVSIDDVLKDLGGSTGHNGHRMPQKPQPKPKTPGKVVATYNYTDEKGNLLFCVCRFEPKEFRQKAPDGKGGWIYKLEGVRRVLYNLPKVLTADFVWIVEGEKDADNLNAFEGMVATTNCGGAEKWLPEYTQALRGKDVGIIPDNDAAGQKHLEKIREELGPVVKSLRVIELPKRNKDVTDFLNSFPSHREGILPLCNLADAAETLYQGQSIPVQSMEEMEEEYVRFLQQKASHQLVIGSWLPGFREIRPIIPGELVTILAGTGCGKTMLLQNLALSTKLPTLMFEVELPSTLSFERFVAMATESSGGHVESTYKMGSNKNWKASGKLSHIHCVHKSKLTTAEIERIINNAFLKTSVRPVLVLIDYIQLLRGAGERYDRISTAIEELKTVAKDTGTIIVVSSQIGRAATANGKEKEGPKEVGLTDAKESGSIENSSGLVIGAWRDATDTDRLWLRILKNTKGKSGRTIPCRILESLKIVQEANEA